ncbi:apolipoprotein N-acyltransferase [Sphingomonas canadensis]|uniref:Apolipoprotein N-acyltransferase n=1 Tax=Sphingomonas canadensis TaxID=1219257 RepID=A0ABW3HB26_9SPHN|nr:apolipoprotein N-acyltransferase [Sphingomonas canadensis]MCW3838392.1 apolipoprotein N-acyltransferase [Sphingomonas canadensis]
MLHPILSRRPVLIAFAAGLVSATGFAPLELWPVLLAALALLLHLVFAAPTLRAAMLRGWAFGVGHFTVGNNWIQHAFDFQDKMPPALGYGAVALLALYLAVYPALAMGLAWKFGRRGDTPDAGFVLIAAAAWIVAEWLRGGLFTGYPWNPLAVAWVPVPGVRDIAAFTGTYALSGIAILAAGALLLALRRRWHAAGTFAATLLAVTAVTTLARPEAPAPAARRTVAIVQPNIGQEDVLSDYRSYSAHVLERLIALSGKPGARPRLLLWPEGMVNYYLEDGYRPYWYDGHDPRYIRARIAALLGPGDMALLSGNALRFDERDRIYGAGNSVWPLAPSGMLGTRYDKAHLVPYGEYLPLRALLAPLGLARLVMGDIDFLPGPGPRTIPVPGFGKAGIQVCYEIIFSGAVVDRADRPDFIFNPSNDAWFGSWGPPQHLAQARLRAIEEGLPVLRATPTGVSAVIDARGRLMGTIGAGREGLLELPMPGPLPPTLFARLGNWLAFAAAALFVVMTIAIRRAAR